ncbi:MAG: GerMN domain-containing protein [Actinomycetes bacterium]
MSAGRRAVVVLVVALLAVATSCGIQADGAPRPLTVSTTTTLPRPTTTAGNTATALFVTRDGTVVPVTRELPDQQAQTVLDALVGLRPPDVGVRGASNAVPSGTEVRSAVRTGARGGSVLAVDLSSRFDRVVGPSRQLAVAQLVMTATGLPGVQTVRFSIDGSPVTVPTPERGDAAEVTACDVRSLLADPDSPESAGLSARSAARLTERSDALEQECR